MFKQTNLLRFSLIIRMLRKQPSTFDEINEYLAKESELQSFNSNITNRTFYRDLDDILAIFDIDIQFDFSKKVYFINDEAQPEVTDRVLAAIDIFNTLNGSDQLSKYIHFDHQGSQGTKNLFKVLYAIKNGYEVHFDYQKYWDDAISRIEVEPYALKEFRNRWHLIAKDVKDNKIRIFALERLTNISITKKTFIYPRANSIEEQCRNSFGAINQYAEEPQQILLWFEKAQLRYIRTFPLHVSQKVIMNDVDGSIIALKLCITRDLIKELLSFGNTLKVLQPLSLSDKIRQAHYNAFMQYSKLD